MRKDNIKTYIDNKVKQGKDDISKVNSLIEIYLEGYIHGALLEANELKDEYKEHEEEIKEILKEFKEQSKEAIKNNTYSLDEETIKHMLFLFTSQNPPTHEIKKGELENEKSCILFKNINS